MFNPQLPPSRLRPGSGLAAIAKRQLKELDRLARECLVDRLDKQKRPLVSPLFAVGLDLGKQSDFSALAIDERTRDLVHKIRHLHRWPGQAPPGGRRHPGPARWLALRWFSHSS